MNAYVNEIAGRTWCYLYAPHTTTAADVLAAQIGVASRLRTVSAAGLHYTITARQRRKALTHGAVEVSNDALRDLMAVSRTTWLEEHPHDR